MHRTIVRIALTVCLAATLAGAQSRKPLYDLSTKDLIKIAESGDRDAQFMLGRRYKIGEKKTIINDAEGVRWLLLAAQQDHVEAAEWVGDAYHGGTGVEKNAAEAFRWYVRSANLGGYTAAFRLVFSHFDLGEFPDLDMAMAARWMQASIEKVDYWGQAYLGHMYVEGLGVARDISRGLKLSRAAADKSIPFAMFQMGRCYEEGIGVERDAAAAVFYFEKVAKVNVDWQRRTEDRLTKLRAAGFAQGREPGPLVIVNTNTSASASAPPTAPQQRPSAPAQTLPTGTQIANRPAQPAYNPDEYASRIAATTSQPVVALPDVERPLLKRAGDAHAYAVIIAAERYRKPIPNVPFALRDAATFKDYLTSTVGVPERNIRAVADATMSDLAVTFGWLEDQARADTSGKVTLYVYYAGHGVPDEQSQTPYLLPVDARPDQIRRTGYSLKTMTDMLAALPARSVIFLDACFSGAASRGQGNEGLMAGKRPAFVDVKVPTASNVTIFSASQANQTSNALPETQHGLFTYFLLSGLNGKAADAQGRITLDALYKYVREEVSTAATRMGQAQTPTLTGTGEIVLH